MEEDPKAWGAEAVDESPAAWGAAEVRPAESPEQWGAVPEEPKGFKDLSRNDELVIERPALGDIRATTRGGPPVRFAPLSEQAAALGLEASAGWEHANTAPMPILRPKPGLQEEVDASGDKQQRLAMGMGQSVADSVNWFASPMGVATLGIGALPRLAQRIFAGLFLAKMVKDAPEIATELGTELGKPEEERDYQKIGQLTGAGVQTLGFAPLLGAHAFAPKALGGVTGRMLERQVEKAKLPGVEEAAVEGGTPIEMRIDQPTAEQVPAAAVQPELPLEGSVDPFAGPPDGGARAGPDVQTPAVEAPVAGEVVTHSMGSSSSAMPVPAAVPAPTAAPAPLRPTPLPGPVSAFLKDVDAFRSATAPQTSGPVARFAGNLLRFLNAQMANRMLRADESLKAFRSDFDRTPVPKGYRYAPGDPLPRNYRFIDAYEGGSAAGLGLEEAKATREFKKVNDQWLDRVHALGTGALETLVENYFPHLWKDPEAAKLALVKILAKAPLEGPKSFLKKRTHQLFRDGLAAGLEPVHDNPVDLFLLKHREVERFILGKTFVNEMKAAGLLKFVHVFEKEPLGYATVNDRAFTVYGPPTVEIKEAFDAGMRAKTYEVLDKIGMPHERKARIGGKRWGYAQYQKDVPGTERLVTKFGGPPDVIWHELGHGIDNRYPQLRERLFEGKAKQTELRALADLRFEGQTPSKSYKRYVRSTEEKMAVVLQAYLHAPEKMRSVAPTIMGELRKFLGEHPELAGIEEIRPTLKLGVGKTEISHGGLLKLGNWYMPAEAAKVVNNYLSPGLQKFGIYNTLRSTSNILNAAQLGLSAFHLGFTSLDAAVSRLAVGLEDVSRGKLLRGAGTLASVPISPITNIMRGAKLRAEVLRPGSGTPEVQQMVKGLEAAGGRVGQDAFWQTQYTRRMLRAFHEATASGYIKGVISAPFALVEQAMRPIMEYVVPRQKLGVFADMARREIERLGPNADPAAVREAMRKAWDSVDNRMGQLVYDNLFYNRVVKDLALLSFRAYGWQLGKYRELGGAVIDVAQQAKALARGERPQLTHRMAYALALPILVGTMGAMTQYLMTGKKPADWRDYFMPRTGEVDENGREVRISLPSYMKDTIAIAKHPVTSTAHSLNPMISMTSDLLSNRDYYDTRIFNPDDPLAQKLKDVGLFLGKQFIPFSVQGLIKLREDAAPLQKQVLPFFGIVPTPKRVTMTSAETMAAEAMAERMPKGSRTKEQFDRSKLIKEVVAGMKGDAGRQDEALGKYRDGMSNAVLNANSMATMMERMKYTPLQFQVQHLDSERAMRVWRVADPAERQQIYSIIGSKVTSSKTVPPNLKAKWVEELNAGMARKN